MTRSAARATALAAGICFLLAAPSSGRAFRYVKVGDTLEAGKMPSLGSGKTHLLDSKSKANVFLFVRPDQEHSQKALAELAALEGELDGRPVHAVVIVSDRFDPEEIRAVTGPLGLSAPVLIDEDDALLGRLGVSLHPVAGIANEDFELVAYQQYNNLRFTPLIKAQVQHLLGDLSDEELEKILNPLRSSVSEEGDVARRNLRFAEKLLQRGSHESALKRAQKVVDLQPSMPEGHALVGAILSAMGDCPAALAAFDKALAIDPDNERAADGKEACAAD